MRRAKFREGESIRELTTGNVTCVKVTEEKVIIDKDAAGKFDESGEKKMERRERLCDERT